MVEGIRFGGLKNPSLRFADDTFLLVTSNTDLQLALAKFADEFEALILDSI